MNPLQAWGPDSWDVLSSWRGEAKGGGSYDIDTDKGGWVVECGVIGEAFLSPSRDPKR